MDIGAYSFDQFKEIARSFHSYPAPGLLIGGYMVERAKAGLPEGTLYEAVVETGKCLPDAVQLLTPCSLGNGWMKIENLGRYALALFDKYTGEGQRVWINPNKLDDWPEIRDWFLKRKSKQEQDSERLFAEIEEAGDCYLEVAPVQVSRKYLHKRGMGSIGICPVCKEAYPGKDGAICRGCQGESPYMGGDSGKGLAPDPECVPVGEAVGKRALHDMTKIIPGSDKDAAFRAGHEFTVADICRLQTMGRSRVYVQGGEASAGEWVHENEAAAAFAERMAGSGVYCSPNPKEGKISFYAEHEGLLRIDRDRLIRFNLVPNVMCASRQMNLVVEKDKPFAGCRAIPLYLSREDFSRALAALDDEPLFEVLALKRAAVGVLVTGTEVFQGVVADKFRPIVASKVQKLNCEVTASEIVPDDRRAISDSVQRMLGSGVDLIVTTAGLSVDPDDVTREGLVDAGLQDTLYGAPILPGAMTLLGRIGATRIMGVPACALFFKSTSFDLLLPRVLAGVEITRKDLASMAEGGFCLGCKSCTFPKCPFGK
jgi:formylmethanofuran dehydrogenase subunit E